MTKLESALTYASWGWHVFPLVPNGKEPATVHGVHDATIDTERIKTWWGRNPDYNIGVASGKKSGVLVFDVDPRNGGDWSWDDWLEEMGGDCLKICAMQQTAGGGQHFIAFYDLRIKSCKLFPKDDPRNGVDVLGDGRYFVVSPSTVDNKEYCWELSSDPNDGIPPFQVPENWIEKIITRNIRTEAVASDDEFLDGGRSDALTAVGGALRHHGLKLNEILAALEVVNDNRCKPPLPDSDVARIAQSVARYEPEEDLAANAALGAMAIENILAGVYHERSDYYFTSASSFLDQPSFTPWLIKGWIPEASQSMVFGQSGIGKTFVAIDMACSIASGQEWFNNRVKSGPVAYMAGEGNFGIRQRVASWCKHHNIDKHGIKQLFVSNKPIDLDSPGASVDVLKAIAEMTEERLSVIFIDTLNRHMLGDENSAKEVKQLLSVCSVLTSATGAAVVLVHHTGHQGKDRERGSSAIRGAMDASIHVKPGSKNHIIIECAKQKDAPIPGDLCAKLHPIDLGWIDEDGNQIEGMVAIPGDITQGKKDDDTQDIDYKSSEYRQIFEDAWFNRGAELNQGTPYLTRGALNDYLLMKKPDWAPRTVKNHLTKSRKSGMIGKLIEDCMIQEKEAGWIMIDAASVSVMLILKNYLMKGLNNG